MSGMFNLAYILQFVVHGLYHRSFPQHNLIVHRHKAILHVVPDTCDEVYIADKEDLGKLFGDVALVGEELAEYRFEEAFVFQWLPIVHVCLGNRKIQYLAPVVYDDVQLEAVEPAHRRLAHLGNTLEHFVPLDTLVVTDPDRGGIHKGNTRTLPQTAGLQKYRHRHKYTLAKLHEAVIGYRSRKFTLHMSLYIELVKVLEAPKSAQMKEKTDGYYLALGHRWRTLGQTAYQKRPGGFFEIFAELIYKTKNITNFRVVNHKELYLSI